ncbi:sugar phosphate nucleotidyltransferase [Chitinophagaceae bacterium LB-8]|uniref:Sugar phosphate nucleotidyltransferase n=1 Tax=Paraflavisolibacter caeni TaxID=2982496 RepID=A0A9X3BK94_9BACT|nr:sugar phosphate nucleotidyltransferase [Paraflavisolibacter caeni]MCU7552473.1 sugar phosphate nucleotidyltransferase [Paraflavisolibacter caeni]
MKPTLVIMAAGMASRYGSMKQIQQFGPGGETIMDYSIYDAIKAGFGKVVFIIRKDFAEDFKSIFEPKLKGKIETDYVYQEMTAYLDGHTAPAERTKPWGTSHAILCAQGIVNEPFAVINADDFYGRDAFQKAHNFLVNGCDNKTFALVGYELSNTLSENGSVSRGVCEVDDNDNLVQINERLKVYRDNGAIVFEESDGIKHPISDRSKASMNFWCFAPSIFPFLEKEFKAFLDKNISNIKAEFLIPLSASDFVKKEGGVIKVIPTAAKWFGVTYKEDAPVVKENLNQLVTEGVYPQKLW